MAESRRALLAWAWLLLGAGLTLGVAWPHPACLLGAWLAQPALAIGALTACIPLDNCEFATKLAAVSVHCDRAFIDEKMVQDAHQRGLAIYVYTVNDQREALRLKALGVDGIFCNYPAEAAGWF